MEHPTTEPTSNAAARARRIVRTSFVGIAANVLVAAFRAVHGVAFENLPADWRCPHGR